MYEDIGAEIGKLVEEKQMAYGDSFTKSVKIIKVFLEPYYDVDSNSYIVPPELLEQLLIQIRIIDKQFRIFSNPKGDRMNESPYMDIAGYSILGVAKEKNR